jgi:hypothetical protein
MADSITMAEAHARGGNHQVRQEAREPFRNRAPSFAATLLPELA